MPDIAGEYAIRPYTMIVPCLHKNLVGHSKANLASWLKAPTAVRRYIITDVGVGHILINESLDNLHFASSSDLTSLVHEMVHLLERHHNERFRAWKDRLMPSGVCIRRN